MNTQILKLCLILCFVAVGCADKTKDWKSEAPTFDDFPTSWFCDSSFMASNPNFENSKIEFKYISEIRKQYQSSSQNFNCNYLITSVQKDEFEWETNIFNSYTGKFVSKVNHKYGAEFSKESSLIIFDGIEGGKYDKMTQFWIMKDEKLLRLK